MKPAPRFWPLATLILLPVLVLTVVAAYGLKDHWNQTHNQARVEGGKFARKAAQVWEEMLRRPAGKTVSLYPSCPAPVAPDKEEADLNAAIAAGDVAALRRLAHIQTGQPLTSSGLPVRLLAAWQLWKHTAAEDERHHAGMLALHRDACVLSPRILKNLDAAADAPPAHDSTWMDQWHDLERRRHLAAQIPHYRQRTIWREDDQHRAWLVRKSPGDGISVTLDAELQRAYSDASQSLREDLPAWAGFLIDADSRLYGPAHEWRGEPDYGMAQVGEFFRIVVYMRDYEGFSAGHLRLEYWTWSIVAAAAATAMLGLWLVRRTLNKERRLGELKSQFVSSVSHELRAPVGSLRLMAEGLASGKVSGAAADEFHRLMAGEGARLSSLIENVLDFARIEQGRKEYHMAETDIAALVQDAVKLMSPHAEARRLRIDCECEALPFVPHVDAGAVQQALINLLDNAIKFSPPDNEVRVSLTADPSRNSWSLAVTDHGPGIPREEHARIFERFYRLGNELRREATGTGIGLAIVKHIVESHDGRVEVESKAGSGSVFRMIFPARSCQ